MAEESLDAEQEALESYFQGMPVGAVLRVGGIRSCALFGDVIKRAGSCARECLISDDICTPSHR